MIFRNGGSIAHGSCEVERNKMDPLLISAASGMKARMESLDMLANNIANGSTGGYKADREFYSLYMAPEAAGSAPSAGTLPVIEKPWTDFSQGELRSTGNPLDLALAGKGFFVVQGPAGPLYTRDGSFRLSPAGVLVAADGLPVRDAGGGTIALSASAASPIEITRDGEVRQDGRVAGQIELVDFADPAALEKQGHSYFRLADPNTRPGAPSTVEVNQGKLENSNVSSTEAAVRLVTVMRQFEMLQKVATLDSDMNRKAVEEVARV
jgi:flagellar basal-body rod protein FlgF